MTEESENVVYLEIENNLIKCNKNDLTKHSDYFKAMLEGNFVEKDLSQIKIEGVQLKAVNIILKLLWEEFHFINEQDILPVLQAACMLQFENIKHHCLEQINEILRVDNCIKIWVVTDELSLKPISLKAKLLALQEFMEIKDSESLLELNLEQILDYLGNIYLKTDSELTVFQITMKWWYENSEYFVENSFLTLLKLLSCVDFNSLEANKINEIMIYPDINQNKIIMDILEAVRKLKRNEQLSDIPRDVLENAQLLYNSKARISPFYISLLSNAIPLLNEEGGKSSSAVNEQINVVYYDKFKRRRVLFNLLTSRPENVMGVYYDEELQSFKGLFVVDQSKCENLEGFKVVGYKEFVFLFGGQYLIGKGEWNVNFWVYDSVRERWERKTRLPYCRRHFETCIVGNNVVVAGGIGNYRIIQENSFYYDYKNDEWSKIRALPQMKCCDFLNKCFFLHMVEKCGFFWKIDGTPEDIIKVNILVDEQILKRQSEFAIFSYKDKFYIKGKDLIEFEMEDNMLVMKSVLPVTNLDCDKIEVVAFNGLVYTFYKYKTDDGNLRYSLERLNLLTKNIYFIFKDLSDNDRIGENAEAMFLINPKLKLFTISHYSLVEKNIVINNSFRNIASAS